MPDKLNQVSIRCPACASTQSFVTMTRSHDGRTYRRRKCHKCDTLFTTQETYVVGSLLDAALSGGQANDR